MVGFVMYEIDCGVGYILRLMIDRKHQRRGYGRAALVEVIRRLRLEPEVEMVGASHRHDNAPVTVLFGSLGFVPWELEGITLTPGEVYLRLPSPTGHQL
jgi:diamine N-acetyltransferase